MKLPFIKDFNTLSLKEIENSLVDKGQHFKIDRINWEEYPYLPKVDAYIARNQTHLVILYKVDGLDLRAKAMEDNGRVWEDSCCEFFVSHPTDGTYYNFELNCIGTLLVSKRTSRHDPKPWNQEQLNKVLRFSSLERKEYDISGPVKPWTVAMCIPMELIGLDKTDLPKELRANFYKCGDKTANVHFVSWSPINLPSPDFHCPQFFGTIRLD